MTNQIISQMRRYIVIFFIGLVLPHTWICSYADAASETDYYDGIRPIVILENDLLELKLNREVLESMVALEQDPTTNSFVTHSEAKAAITEQLSSLDGINEELLNHYLDYLSPLIGVVDQKLLQQEAIDGLIAQGHSDAADSLSTLVDQPIKVSDFNKVIKNKLEAKLALEPDATEQEAVTPEASEAVLLEKETDEAFKSIVKEIVATGDDSETLIEKLIQFAKKVNPIGKDFAALKQAKDARKAAAELALKNFNKTHVVESDIKSDSDVYKNSMAILVRTIKKHQLAVIELKKKNKLDEADKEQFIVDELIKIYTDELNRVEKSKKIDKINEQIKILNQVADFKAQIEVKNSASEKESSKQELIDAQQDKVDKISNIAVKSAVTQSRYSLTLTCEVYSLLPTISNDVYDAVANLVGVFYLSTESLADAVDSVTKSLSKDVKALNSSCLTQVKSEQNSPALKSSLELIISKANKLFKPSQLTSVNLGILPGCTSCSAPFKGLSYGFYPYWNASEEYSSIGLNNLSNVALDYSVFTNIAYFALPVQKDGKITDEMHLENTNFLKNYFETLSTYNVKRDVVLYLSDWVKWHEDPNIDVYEFAKDHYQFILKKNQDFASLGGISGVTFYFDHYTSEQNVDQLVRYIQHFKAQMQTSVNGSGAETFDINLLLGLEGLESQGVEIGEKLTNIGPNYFAKIKSLILSDSRSQEGGLTLSDIDTILTAESDSKDKVVQTSSIVSHVLVVMNEQTSPFKKLLRSQIESEFSGGERVEALLSIVPIMNRTQLLEAGNESYFQFQDDIAYLKYNFGGMGLWNLPYTSLDKDGVFKDPALTMSLYAHLLKKDYSDASRSFLDYGKVGVVGQVLMNPFITKTIDVCGTVCPKRDIFVWLFALATLANGIVWLLWKTQCKARVLIKKIWPAWPVFQMCTAALFFLLLGCIPSWQAESTLILGSTIVVVLLVLGFTYFSNGYEKEVQ